MRFRNHISIIIEEFGKAIIILFVFLFGSIDEIINFFRNENRGFHLMERQSKIVLLVILGSILLITLMLIYRVIVWSKTYIEVKENVIVFERDTLNSRRNAIGIKNISNINIEQNLFEMLLGTCKVKLDTNSRSTANQTDLKIVLKKDKAAWFKAEILKIMTTATSAPNDEANSQSVNTSVQAEDDIRDYDITTTTTEQLEHGLFSIHLFSILVILGIIIGFIIFVGYYAKGQSLAASIVQVLVPFITLGGMLFTYVWSIVKEFIEYYDFKVKRRDDKLLIRYGFFKKHQYSIPVSTINGIKLSQTFIARIFKRYKVEIVNIGMGDEQSEQSSFLILYSKLDKLEEELKVVLPEFSLSKNQAKKQPRGVFTLFGISLAIQVLIGGIAVLILRNIKWLADYSVYMILAVALYALFIAVVFYFSYQTKGIFFDEDRVEVISGCFGRTIMYLPYNRIQYVSISSNMVSRKYQMVTGHAYILASLKNTGWKMPYFEEDYIEYIKERILLS